MTLLKYKCHKEVSAVKITQVIVHAPPEGVAFEGGFLFHDTPEVGSIAVSAEYFAKHNPEAGGYYVLYEDGYESYSPAKAFEDGYTLLSAPAEPPPVDRGQRVLSTGMSRGSSAGFHTAGGDSPLVMAARDADSYAVSKPFGDLARQILAELPANPERTTAMRKLLEAKDCAVRALLFKQE